MDPGSVLTSGNGYFKQLVKKRSLFFSDDTLMLDPVNRAYIIRQSNNGGNNTEFFSDLAASMVKMRIYKC
jgi:hypothetical protein